MSKSERMKRGRPKKYKSGHGYPRLHIQLNEEMQNVVEHILETEKDKAGMLRFLTRVDLVNYALEYTIARKPWRHF